MEAVSIACLRNQGPGLSGPVTILPGGLGRILFYNLQAPTKEEEALSIILGILHEAHIRWPRDLQIAPQAP